MRYFRIFLIYFQDSFESRSKSFVWFLISLLNPLIILLFWYGAIAQNGEMMNISFSSLASYYFLLVIANSLLTAHIEEYISKVDIKEGRLSTYLLLPFPYIIMKFFQEFPYRLIQGGYGCVICLLALLFFPNLFTFSTDALMLSLAFVIAMNALLLSFLFKSILGILAFWLVDVWGFYQITEIVLLIFAGYILPLYLFPEWVINISYMLPFAYMIYFPIVAFLGELQYINLLSIILIQCVWLFLFAYLYRFLWKTGLKQYAAVGQ